MNWDCGIVGIVGAGHLGLALAEAMLSHGLPKEHLLLSYGGRAETKQRLQNAGLLGCVANNVDIARRARLIFVTVRPRNVDELAVLRSTSALVVSCMAGIGVEKLQSILGRNVVRVMPSGPETILNGQGIAGAFPVRPEVNAMLETMGLRVFKLDREQSLHGFTVGVCVPAALLAMREGEDVSAAVEAMEREVACFGDLMTWAKSVLPQFANGAERERYIRAMATPGGVTEAIVRCLRSGGTLAEALVAGCRRSEAIALL